MATQGYGVGLLLLATLYLATSRLNPGQPNCNGTKTIIYPLMRTGHREIHWPSCTPVEGVNGCSLLLEEW